MGVWKVHLESVCKSESRVCVEDGGFAIVCVEAWKSPQLCAWTLAAEYTGKI